MKPSDTVETETSVTNGAADDAIDNTKDDDRDEDNSAAEQSPAAAADDDDCAEALDEAMVQSAAGCSRRVTTDAIQQLATLLGDSWLQLAAQLHFQLDDISYFQTENSMTASQATNMLTVWTVSTRLESSGLVSEMTYYVSSGTLNSTNSTQLVWSSQSSLLALLCRNSWSSQSSKHLCIFGFYGAK